MPILLGTRYVAFVGFGVYRRIWRYAGARDLASIAAATFVSAPVALGLLAATRPLKEFPWEIFVVDALLCFVLVSGSRLVLRALPQLRDRGGRRVLVVGAGRSGRSLARELQETAGERVIGFLDDNVRLRRRRIQGVIVIGDLDEAERFVPGLGRGARLDPGRARRAAPTRARRLHRRRRPLPVRPARHDGGAAEPRRGDRRVTSSAPAETAERRPLERALDALPLVLAYVLLCCLYAWQASRRDSPTIFTDELEFAQISRSIAETGEAARRGVPYGFQTLHSFLVAPAWWIDDTASAYEAAKFIGVLVMTATIFPAYALARTIVSKPWALGAAVAAAAIPALSYAPFLVEEPLAYPVATTALWLIARALARPTLWTIATAALVCLLAVLVRAQLAILIPVLALALAARGLGASLVPAPPRAVVARATGSGVVLLAIGAALALSAFLGHRSEEWYRATGFYKERMFDYGLRALGALVIGIGVLPFVAGLTAVLTRGRDPDRNVRAFVLTSLAAFFTFGLYTAIKAAYISTEFGNRHRRAQPDLRRAAPLRRHRARARAARPAVRRAGRRDASSPSTCS